MDKKPLQRVGVRNVKVTGIETRELKNAADSHCPFCKRGPLDGTTGFSFETEDGQQSYGELEETKEPKGVVPYPGCPTICGYCTSLLVFGETMNVQIPTRQQIAEWQSDPDMWNTLRKMQLAVGQIFKNRRL